MNNNIILDKSVDFSVALKIYCRSLYFKKEVVIANQLLRSGFAIGANISEAQQAESRSDFIHKMKLAAKEASETLYWLRICQKTDIIGFQQTLIDELSQMNAIIAKIIITSKKNTQ